MVLAMDKTLKRGMINVLCANIINLFFSLITSFILPKYLSVESYSLVKTFQLYVNYAGLLHLGYVDGMYLKYGGIKYENIDKNDFKKDLSTVRIFQFIVTIIWIFIGFLAGDYIIIAFALSILPQNMNSYFRYLYQSIGEFKKYSNILNLTTIGTFIANLILLFILKTDNSFWYCISYVIIYILTWLVLEIQTVKSLKEKLPIDVFSLEHLKSNIKSGILLMLGTFSSIILTSIDRLFVKFTLDAVAFAQYSFAVTMDNFINTAVTPITVTMYNYFCRKKDECNYEKIRNYISIFSVFIVSFAFPAKFVLEVYLKNYISTVNVLFLLFAAQICFITIKGVYVNIYKVKRMQKRYFLKLLSVIIVGCMFNLICFHFYPYKESFALGTLFSSVYWLIISLLDFKFVKIKFKEIVYYVSEIFIFLTCGFYLNSILGFFIYIILSLLLTIICYHEVVLELVKNLLKYANNNKIIVNSVD